MLSLFTAHTIVASLFFLTSVVAVVVPICGDAGGGDLYGHPSFVQCEARLSLLNSMTDNRDHFFGLPSVTRRPQNPIYALDVSRNQWTNKVQLPVVKEVVPPVATARCNLGIFPIELPDGSLSFDSSHYYMLERDGRSVLECIRRDRVGNSYVGPGGRVITGRFDRLALILYEPGSEWDFQVQQAQAQNRPIYVPLNAPGNPPLASLSRTALRASATATSTGSSSWVMPTFKPEPGIKTNPCGPRGRGDPWLKNCGYGDEGQGSS